MLRVATWNLQSCARGLDRVAAQLRALEADVVLLQEVDRCTRRAGHLDQIARLGELCGFGAHAFFEAMPWDDRGGYGLGMLSRHELADVITVALPTDEGTEQRVLGAAKVRSPAGELRVGVAHLSHRRTERSLRAKQVQRIRALFADESLPVVLGGDFNDLPDSGTHRSLTADLHDLFDAVGHGDGGTHPLAPGLTLRIDYLFGCRQIAPIHARVVTTSASDHHALVADVRITPTSS